MPFSGPFRYYSIFVLLFVTNTIRRFGGPNVQSCQYDLSMRTATD